MTRSVPTLTFILPPPQVPAGQVACTNSKGLIWRAADGSEGSFRNNEQKGVAVVGKPDVSTDLKAPILTMATLTMAILTMAILTTSTGLKAIIGVL